ncbi:unnamed protein product [Xylocopa violacea]|uniref:Uncharacterized protein n=1 Tax=Xylocopa violacea TaxID=135666 RepID=A0ABP1P2L0_XYLVO
MRSFWYDNPGHFNFSATCRICLPNLGDRARTRSPRIDCPGRSLSNAVVRYRILIAPNWLACRIDRIYVSVNTRADYAQLSRAYTVANHGQDSTRPISAMIARDANEISRHLARRRAVNVDAKRTLTSKRFERDRWIDPTRAHVPFRQHCRRENTTFERRYTSCRGWHTKKCYTWTFLANIEYKSLKNVKERTKRKRKTSKIC